MKRIVIIMVCVLIFAGIAWAQNPQHMATEIIILKARLWDQLTAVVGDEPLALIQRQSRAIEQAIEMVHAHKDTTLIRKFQEAGFPVQLK